MPSRLLAVLLAALLALGSVPASAAGVVTSVGAAGEGAAAGQAGAVVTGRVNALSLPTVSLTASLTPTFTGTLAPSLRSLPAESPAPLSAQAASPLQAAHAAPSAATPVTAPPGSLLAAADGPRQEGTPRAQDSLDAAGKDAASVPQEGEGLEAGKTGADARFDGAGEKKALDGAAPVRGRWGRRSWLGLAATSALAFGLFSRSGPSQAVPVPDVAASDIASAAGGGLLHGVGQFGYIAGNALAFIFPVFEIYRVYKTGSAAKTPVVRSALLIGAYVAVGMFVLTLSGLPLWAIQNLFGAATLAAVWPSAWVARKFSTASAEKRFSLKAAAFTALSTAVAGGLSVGLYYLVAAPFIPGLVMSLFGAAAIGGITLGIQIAAAAVQALLFLPDLIKLYKGKVGGEGFSEGFTLALMLASFFFVLYSVVRAMAEPFGTTTMWQMALYAALYTLYTVSSGATWWLGRRKKAS